MTDISAVFIRRPTILPSGGGGDRRTSPIGNADSAPIDSGEDRGLGRPGSATQGWPSARWHALFANGDDYEETYGAKDDVIAWSRSRCPKIVIWSEDLQDLTPLEAP